MYLRERKIFRSREDLLWFERCVRLEDRVEAALTAKDWEEGYAAYQDIQVPLCMVQVQPPSGQIDCRSGSGLIL